MKKLNLLLFIAVSLLMMPNVQAQVQEIIESNEFASNDSSDLTKVDWNWQRIWISDDATKVQHGILHFSVGDYVDQALNTASITFNYETLDPNNSTVEIEFFYKENYTIPTWEAIDYPNGCVVLGSITLSELGDYTFSSEALKDYIVAQTAVGEDAAIIMRSKVAGSIVGILGNLQIPILTLDAPGAFQKTPSVSISKSQDATTDICIAPTDAITLNFSKAMDKSSVESNLLIVPAPDSKSFTWEGDTTAYVICSGLNEMTDVTFTLPAGTSAADGTLVKSDKSSAIFMATNGIVKSESNFWILDNGSGTTQIKTNALSVAYSSYTDIGTNEEVLHNRRSFIYVDLSETDATTDFKGIMIKMFLHQDATTWQNVPIDVTNTDYKLYDVAYSSFGESFDGAAYEAMTTTFIDDIVIDSINTVYTFDSQEILDYLTSKAGEKICIAIVDETSSDYKATSFLSDPNNNPVEGAPVVLYSSDESASLTSISTTIVSVYPQPVSNGYVNFSGVQVNSVEVYSFAGICLTAKSLVNNELDISDLSSGLYLIKMDTNEGNVVQQLLVK